MCVCSSKIYSILLIWTSLAILTCAEGNVQDDESSGLLEASGFGEEDDDIDASNDLSSDGSGNSQASFRRSYKRGNIKTERESELVRKAEDILMDEIKGSEQAANRAEISYDIPKETEYLDASMKAGDFTDTDTSNMIGYNEKKGAYLPVLAENGATRDVGSTKKLSEQLGNNTGAFEFWREPNDDSNIHPSKNVSLLENVPETVQPTSNAISGLKQLLEENRVEQSLKKGLDLVPNLGHSVIHQEHNLANPLDNTAVSTSPLGEGVPLSTGFITRVNQDQMFDESVSPPEQLLDELSQGKFKHPLSDGALEKMSNWNANKEYLVDNGFFNLQGLNDGPKLSRISSAIRPVHDVYLKPKPVVPTALMSKGQMDLLGRDPEILGRNQQFLNGGQYHSISDLDAIGPPVYPGSVVQMPHKSRHVFMPTKHTYAHVNGINMYANEDEGARHWQYHGGGYQGDRYRGGEYHRGGHHEGEGEYHGGGHHEGEGEYHGGGHHEGEYHRGGHHAGEYHEDGHQVEHFEDHGDGLPEEEYYPHHQARSARCSHRPCLNGGKCTALIERYVCTCREGFMGSNCEKHSFCYPNPCKHGTCSSNTENFICTCSMGWQGKRCDEKDKCHPGPCMHGGTCTSTYTGVFCSCAPGFKGTYCESEAKCSPLNPCLNGGRCQELPFIYICICKNGFSGRNCDVILNPTPGPPTVEMKPVPPQAIPAPNNQAPFLLEELNSLSDGPLQEHAMPETRIDATTIQDENHFIGHVAGHHVHEVVENYHDDHGHHGHDSQHLTIEQSPSLVIHTGDPMKESKNKPKPGKDDKTKRKNKAPPDSRHDDRYQTHLVAAAFMKGRPVDEPKPDDKKPPLETAEQVNAKPTQKEDAPKQLVPTAEILKRLENAHPVENQVYTDAPKKFIGPEVDNFVKSNAMHVRPAVKNEVLKAIQIRLKIKPTESQKKKKVALASLKPSIKGSKSKARKQPIKGSKSISKHHVDMTPSLMCPGFCKIFCDKWCVDVGCCKRTEISGPSAATIISHPKLEVVKKKGVHKCKNCSVDADCVKGVCRCKSGFIGNGKYCAADPCVMCDENAQCVESGCECKIGFFGDGYKCTKFTDYCSRCNVNADCIGNFCFCKPGYFGNGNDCWPNRYPVL